MVSTGVTNVLPVAPVFQLISPTQPLANKVPELPAQIVVEVTTIVTGTCCVTTVTEAVALQPGADEQVTEYTLVTFIGVTVMLALVAPVDQLRLPTQPIVDRVTGVPAVTSVLLACRLTTGGDVTVTVPVADTKLPAVVVQMAV